MKITGFYYLAYPDADPPNPHNAISEVYVEVGGEASDVNSFDCTYSLTICTRGYIEDCLLSESFFACRTIVIVERFDDESIRVALNSILPRSRILACERIEV